MENFKLLEATVSDIPDLHTILVEAFASDAVVGQMEINVEPKLRRQKGEEWWQGVFEHAEIEGTRMFKVIDTSNGKIAAFGKWVYPVTITASQKEEKAAWEKQVEARGFPEGANETLMKDFFGQLKSKREEHVDPTKDYFMHILAVSPPYHRRGLGSLILAEGLNQADAHGAKTYIEASKMGYPLYVKHGWEDIDEIVCDLAKYGIGEGLYVQKCLMRQPRKADLKEERAEARDVLRSGDNE